MTWYAEAHSEAQLVEKESTPVGPPKHGHMLRRSPSDAALGLTAMTRLRSGRLTELRRTLAKKRRVFEKRSVLSC